jgi:hypothetical protein
VHLGSHLSIESALLQITRTGIRLIAIYLVRIGV